MKIQKPRFNVDSLVCIYENPYDTSSNVIIPARVDEIVLSLVDSAEDSWEVSYRLIYQDSRDTELKTVFRSDSKVFGSFAEAIKHRLEAKRKALQQELKNCEARIASWPKVVGFNDDVSKMTDFKKLSKEEFLESYSYLTEEEYDVTKQDQDMLEEYYSNYDREIVE